MLVVTGNRPGPIVAVNTPSGPGFAILDTGAYGMSLASNYNARLRPAEVLVEGRRARVIREREKIEDLLAAERRALQL